MERKTLSVILLTIVFIIALGAVFDSMMGSSEDIDIISINPSAVQVGIGSNVQISVRQI